MDRDQLTEARQWWCESEGATRKGRCITFKGEMIGEGRHARCGWRYLVDPAAFPTDEMVEAVYQTLLPPSGPYRQQAQAALEAVRQVMFGEES